MHRSLHALWILGSLAVAIGCATSDPVLPDPDFDPTLPGVDTGEGAEPAQGATSGGTADGGTSKKKDAGSTSSSGGTDAGKDGAQTIANDSGTDAAPAVPKPAPGELLVTEIMYNALKGAEPASEWIEVYSKAPSTRALSGLVLKDGGGRTHVIGPGVTIEPNAYVLLVRNKSVATSTALVPASSIAYEYGGAALPDTAGILLTNGASGAIAILNGAVTVASVPYGPWFSQSGGSSLQLKNLDAATAGQAASWCLSLTSWGAGTDKGTPGAAEDCP